MREVRLEPVRALDGCDDPSLLGRGEVLSAAASRAREVHVRGLLGPVVLGAALEVRVGQDSGLLEDVEGPVDGRGVHARQRPLDPLDEVGGGDVALGAQDLADDGPPLRGHA